MRAPLWVIVLLILAIIGIGVYGYFTTPLPFGLSAVIPTPGGGNTGTPSATTPGAPAGIRTAAGQPLVLGATHVVVQAGQRHHEPASRRRSGAAGSVTLGGGEVQDSRVPQL